MNTKPDICFSMNTLSQFLVEPRHVHLVAAKHVMRYLKGTIDCGLSYDGDHDFTLSGYTDADWAGSVSDRKITSGCCFSLGSAMISWQSRKQSNISLRHSGSRIHCCMFYQLRSYMASKVVDRSI
jgi:hypothetical protein